MLAERQKPQKTALLSDLKREIGRIEADGLVGAGQGRSPFTTGCGAVDEALPFGGLARGALHEVMAAEHRDRPAALGFLCGMLVRLFTHLGSHDPRPVMWVAQEEGLFDFGSLYGPGLNRFGLNPERLIAVSTRGADDVLWALEEALKCSALAGVVGLFGKGSSALDLTALRRLQLAAERGGQTAFLLRLPSDAPSVVARTRWRISARPSEVPQWALKASKSRAASRNHGIGNPRWQVTLEKCRGGTPAAWQLEWAHAAHCFRLASAVADRPIVSDAPAAETGSIIPIGGREIARVA